VLSVPGEIFLVVEITSMSFLRIDSGVSRLVNFSWHTHTRENVNKQDRKVGNGGMEKHERTIFMCFNLKRDLIACRKNAIKGKYVRNKMMRIRWCRPHTNAN
jgi:hypothetical protein